MSEKRKRVRAIVFMDGKMVSMYRKFQGRTFYVFPGGGMEAEETEEECVKREVFEEFGLVVKPIKKVYVYENESSLEFFYTCEWVSGEFGTGEGEEFQPNRDRGVYRPTLLGVRDIPNLPLMPLEVAKAFVEDFKARGFDLRDDVKFIVGERR